MAGLNLQSADRVDRFVAETALVPTACHSLTGGSSNPPKFGTLIPNRIFVGGIPSNTTEQELKSFFSSFGQVKDVKIISDRLGVSKGSYGFVTFESQEMAEKIIKNESETLIFKDRKLNIGHAIRKQQMFPRADLPAALFFAGGAMPYSIQNGMAVFSLPGQEYPMLTQATAPYATMMLPQPGGGTTLYLPSAASATASPYAQLSQQQVTAALQQQHYQTAGITGGIAPSVAGQLTPVTVSGSNMNAQSNSTAAVMAAAAAAMAAAVQWPQQSAGNAHQTSQQLPSVTTHSVPQTAGTPQTMVQSASLTPQQAAAMAAAVAAQQAAWRWSPTVQQTQTSHATSSTHVSNTGSVTTASNAVGNTTSTPTIQNQSLHTHPQGSPTATTLGPATYLYSPITGTGHELMFFHQTSSPFAANSTSDYSTDHSNHSSGLLESVEPLGFPCDGTPLGRHSQQLTGQLANAVGNQHLDTAACLSPYAAFAPLLDLQSHGSGSGQQNTLIHSTTLQHAFRQHHSASTTILATPQAASGQHIMPIAHAATSLVAQPQQHSKIYSSSILSSNAHTGPAVNACLYTNPPVKINALSELTSPVDAQDASSISQSSAVQTTAVSANGTGLSPHNTTVTQLQASTTGAVQCNASASGLAVDNNSGMTTTTGHR
ncbi:hypothetical protein CRM22_001898 [Opisthorchis felineus]|uniref:RRM domain-containing protein n=1 Tax=Opisthorchis felineus TaxID=147828 RepID=A0A4S2MEX8_OPIFE|nr:hypothetical protein CRM22_001898 [Opisthorchis felineus]